MSTIFAAQGSKIYTHSGCQDALSIKADTLITLDNRFCLDPDQEPSHAIVVDTKSSLVGFDVNRTAIKVVTEKGYETTLHADTVVVTSRGLKVAAELSEDDCVMLMNECPMGYDETTSVTMMEDEVSGYELLEKQYNLGRLLGWLVGDGTIRRSPRQTQYLLYFCHQDIPLAHYFAEQLGGVAVGIHANNGSPNNTKTATVNIPVRLMPKRYETKDELDADLFNMPLETVRGYLRGLFSADGTVDKYTIVLSQSNENRLQIVQKLLLHFGVVCTVSLRSEAGTYNWVKNGAVVATGPKKANYILTISGWNCNKFMEEIGFDVEAKTERLSKQVFTRSAKPYKAESYCVAIESVQIVENHEFNILEVQKPVTHNTILAYSSDGILCVAK